MIRRIKKVVSPLIFQAVALSIPPAAFAAEAIVPTQISGIDSIVTIISTVIRFILIVAFVAAFIMLLIGGIRWILAGGDEKAVAGARGTITAALIGLVIVLVAYAIIRLVEIFFNVSIITGGVEIPVVTAP